MISGFDGTTKHQNRQKRAYERGLDAELEQSETEKSMGESPVTSKSPRARTVSSFFNLFPCAPN